MLVISRRQTERVVAHTAHGPIVISVEKIGASRVRLGIEAPPDVSVLRGELELRTPQPSISTGAQVL